jgi:hypothetical protein
MIGHEDSQSHELVAGEEVLVQWVDDELNPVEVAKGTYDPLDPRSVQRLIEEVLALSAINHSVDFHDHRIGVD